MNHNVTKIDGEVTVSVPLPEWIYGRFGDSGLLDGVWWVSKICTEPA